MPTMKYIWKPALDLVKEIHGQNALDLLKSSVLFEEGYEAGELIIDSRHSLSFNLFETMGSPITGDQFRSYIEDYFRMNEMWPMEKTTEEIARYSLDLVLPLFVKAGLLWYSDEWWR